MTDSKSADAFAVFVNVKQIAHMLGVSRSGIFNLIRSGDFPKGIKIGNSRRWEFKDIREWIDSQKGMQNEE